MAVTRVGFGAWAAGGDWRYGWAAQSDEDSRAAILRALEHGVNWIDTAPVYGLGHSEELVGGVLAELDEGERPYVCSRSAGSCGIPAVRATRSRAPT